MERVIERGAKCFIRTCGGLGKPNSGSWNQGISTRSNGKESSGTGFYNFHCGVSIPGDRRATTKGKPVPGIFQRYRYIPGYSVGIVTARDNLTIKASREEMIDTVKQFIAMDESTAG